MYLAQTSGMQNGINSNKNVLKSSSPIEPKVESYKRVQKLAQLAKRLFLIWINCNYYLNFNYYTGAYNITS